MFGARSQEINVFVGYNESRNPPFRLPHVEIQSLFAPLMASRSNDSV